MGIESFANVSAQLYAALSHVHVHKMSVHNIMYPVRYIFISTNAHAPAIRWTEVRKFIQSLKPVNEGTKA